MAETSGSLTEFIRPLTLHSGRSRAGQDGWRKDERKAKDTVGADIFLSYVREDIKRAEALAKALVAQGWRVFWDRNIPPGDTWTSYIGKALDEARCVVVAWSAAAVQSDCGQEADKWRKRKVLVPVFFENAEARSAWSNHREAVDAMPTQVT